MSEVFFRVNGGIKLVGGVSISGSKNASMPIIIASILSQTPVEIANLPPVSDVSSTLQILSNIGFDLNFVRREKNLDDIHTSVIISSQSNNILTDLSGIDIARKIRTSSLFLGPLLARYGKATIPKPGGCNIGERSIGFHLKIFESLGVVIKEFDTHIEASVANGNLNSADITLPFPSVGATQNALSVCVLCRGISFLRNIALEPEIDDLILFLQSLGAKIVRISEKELKIEGVTALSAPSGIAFKISHDRIESGTFAIASAITSGEIFIKNAPIESFNYLRDIFKRVGVVIEKNGNGTIVTRSPSGIKSCDIVTGPYPAFPTDLQPQMMALLCLGVGKSSVSEMVFENRLQHVPELVKLGYDISIEKSSAVINKTEAKKISNKSLSICGTDLRATAGLVLAALARSANTDIYGVEHLDRGYEDFEGKLKLCGADISRIINQ